MSNTLGTTNALQALEGQLKKKVKQAKKKLKDIRAKLRTQATLPTLTGEKKCLIATPAPNAVESFYLYDDDTAFTAGYLSNAPRDHHVHFADKKQCRRYAEALTTFLLLRKQPGTEAPSSAKQWVILTCGLNSGLTVAPRTTMSVKHDFLSPCFDTEENANLAVVTLGVKRIRKMLHELHS